MKTVFKWIHLAFYFFDRRGMHQVIISPYYGEVMMYLSLVCLVILPGQL